MDNQFAFTARAVSQDVQNEYLDLGIDYSSMIIFDIERWVYWPGCETPGHDFYATAIHEIEHIFGLLHVYVSFEHFFRRTF